MRNVTTKEAARRLHYSGDAQMTSAYWVSRFPVRMLKLHVAELDAIAANEWDSVAVHARGVLEAVRAAV